MFALDGPPEHFHADGSRARVYGNDGSPQRIAYLEDIPYSLVSLDAHIFRPGNFRFMSSAGATYDVLSSGPIVFGPGFQNITYVDLIVSGEGAINIDNIRIVPEPASFAILTAGLGFVVGRGVKKKGRFLAYREHFRDAALR